MGYQGYGWPDDRGDDERPVLREHDEDEADADDQHAGQLHVEEDQAVVHQIVDCRIYIKIKGIGKVYKYLYMPSRK